MEETGVGWGWCEGEGGKYFMYEQHLYRHDGEKYTLIISTTVWRLLRTIVNSLYTHVTINNNNCSDYIYTNFIITKLIIDVVNDDIYNMLCLDEDIIIMKHHKY